MIAAFDYQTDETIKMQMEGLALAQVALPAQSMSVGAQKIKMSGSLHFKQTAAINSGLDGDTRQTYNDAIFDQLEFISADALMHEYVATRNESTRFDYTKTVQYSATDDPLANFIEIEMIVSIPKSQNIIYVPQAPFVIKMGWVQFFYAFLFWYLVLNKGLLNYLVTERVFDCTEVTELNVKNISEEK